MWRTLYASLNSISQGMKIIKFNLALFISTAQQSYQILWNWSNGSKLAVQHIQERETKVAGVLLTAIIRATTFSITIASL
jgi:hypothetical protein